jgi:predicted transcriptional regulator of viral defense system
VCSSDLPDFSYRQLDRWEKKGYLRKLKQGFYTLTEQETGEAFLFLTANKIYAPSYVSLEKALKHYGLIPEEVFQVTSVGTKKTASFETAVGNFSYRHIQPSLFWGYRLLELGRQRALLAEPEKAVLDYLYLHAGLRTAGDFAELRINAEAFREQINFKKFQAYLAAFENKSLTRRAQIFLKTLQDD